MNKKPEVGSISWTDLTVSNAVEIRDFYAQVTGWRPSPVDMGDYNDFMMNMPDGKTAVAGVCHARGVNADLPAQWLIYIVVENLGERIRLCRELGGSVVAGPKKMGSGAQYCVIRDPAGAICALYQP